MWHSPGMEEKLNNLTGSCHYYPNVITMSNHLVAQHPYYSIGTLPPLETYNDLNGEIVNFFKVLRTLPDELIRKLFLTPFAREEYRVAITPPLEDISDLERARRFYVNVQSSQRALIHNNTIGNWAPSKDSSTRGMARMVSGYFKGVEGLGKIATRLLRVQIENRPALEILSRYDSPDTLFYCDPPYLFGTRSETDNYTFEMTDDDHRAFAEVVNKCQAKVAISGYDHALMDELFPLGKWYKTVGEPKGIPSSNKRTIRTEVLWTNYNPSAQATLFNKIDTSLPVIYYNSNNVLNDSSADSKIVRP